MCNFAGHSEEPGFYPESSGKPLEGFKRKTKMFLTFALKRIFRLLCGEWRREGLMEAGRSARLPMQGFLWRDDGSLDKSFSSWEEVDRLQILEPS